MSLTSGVKLHIDLLNVVVQFIVFLTSASLIFRGTDISKCLRESLGIRDNESRLYNEKSKHMLSDNNTQHSVFGVSMINTNNIVVKKKVREKR